MNTPFMKEVDAVLYLLDDMIDAPNAARDLFRRGFSPLAISAAGRMDRGPPVMIREFGAGALLTMGFPLPGGASIHANDR